MKKIISKTLIALAVAGAPAFPAAAESDGSTLSMQNSVAAPQSSQTAIDQDALEADIALASLPEPTDPGKQVTDQMDDWLHGAGANLSLKSDRGEIFLGKGFAAVKGNPDSRDWADYRIMAYKEALMEAQAQFIQWEGISTRADMVSRMFDDQTQMPTFESHELQNTSKLAEVLDKVMAVTTGKLDEQLREMNIDPEEFRAAPSAKRARIFENSISERVAVNARAAITGLVPVKTFEANSANGEHVIAVVVVASTKMSQFVHDLKNSRGDIAADPARASKTPLRDLFAADKPALIHEFGIRKMFDENGYPVLISFGQAGTGYTGSDFSRKMDARKSARLFAQADAYANFAYFLNSTGTANLNTTRASSTTRDGIATLEQGSVIESEAERMELVRIINNEIASRGSVSDLPGTRQLLSWTEDHPQTGHEINGVVYIWHPQSELQARELRNFKPTQTTQTPQQQKPRASGQAGTSQSRDLMSADDF